MKDAAPLSDPPIASDAACADAIAAIGEIELTLKRIETEKSAAIARATLSAENKATPLIGKRTELEAKIAAYCARERDRLTRAGETKTVEFPSGRVAWRIGRGRVEIDPVAKPNVLLALHKIRGFFNLFTVQTVELSKAKMMLATAAQKAKLAKIKGIHFVPGSEGFSIEPTGAELSARPPADEQISRADGTT